MTRRSRAVAQTFAVICGGGTSGHVIPAISIGTALVAGGHRPEEIHFVGSRRGMEAHLVPQAGFSVSLLPGRGIRRSLDRESLAENSVAVAGLVVAVGLGIALLAERRPAVVVSVGGYGSVACTSAAFLLGIPVVVVNPDAVPGLANRLAGRFAAASAVGFGPSRLRRAVVTGAPLRPELAGLVRDEATRERARSALGLPTGRFVVLVTGGSLGARRLNEAVLGIAARLRSDGDLTIYHVTGAANLAEVERGRAELDLDLERCPGLDYRVVGYEDRLDLAYVACDLLIGRGGASTVAEVALLGVPAILVPLPHQIEQTRNVEVLSNAGGAVLLADADCDVERLASLVTELRERPDLRQCLAAAARSFGRPDATEEVVSLVERSARLGAARGTPPRSLVIGAADALRGWLDRLVHRSDERPSTPRRRDVLSREAGGRPLALPTGELLGPLGESGGSSER